MGKHRFFVGVTFLLLTINAKNVLAESSNKDAIWQAVHNNSHRTVEEIKRDKYTLIKCYDSLKLMKLPQLVKSHLAAVGIHIYLHLY